MKTAIVVFPDELLIANTLSSQVTALTDYDSCELWVLGGLGSAPNVGIFSFCEIKEILVGNPENLSEPLCCAEAVHQCYQSNQVDIMLFSSGIRGNDLAARVCAEIGCEAVLGAQELYLREGKVFIKKPVYSNNLQAIFQPNTFPLAVSLALSEETAPVQFANSPEIRKFEAEIQIPAWLTDIENERCESDDLLKRSELVFVGGRGVGKAENFNKLSELAQKMGGVLGGTRPTVCDGKIPPDRMIGMSANVLSPACCFVFGASGAAPFLAGIEKSKLIVAVNRDPNALIFDNCDVGIIADCNEFADALSEQYQKSIDN